jgi:hypothetical protein
MGRVSHARAARGHQGHRGRPRLLLLWCCTGGKEGQQLVQLLPFTLAAPCVEHKHLWRSTAATSRMSAGIGSAVHAKQQLAFTCMLSRRALLRLGHHAQARLKRRIGQATWSASSLRGRLGMRWLSLPAWRRKTVQRVGAPGTAPPRQAPAAAAPGRGDTGSRGARSVQSQSKGRNGEGAVVCLLSCASCALPCC